MRATMSLLRRALLLLSTGLVLLASFAPAGAQAMAFNICDYECEFYGGNWASGFVVICSESDPSQEQSYDGGSCEDEEQEEDESYDGTED